METMKLLVTGAGGMLGQSLSACLESRGHDVVSVPKERLDVTNYSQCLEVIEEEAPDLIIHCGAFTKVDQAESEPALAYHINGYGTENLAVACNIFETPMLYFSSDYVFDGEQNQPYNPWDATRPLSVYGKSKLAGEKAIQRHLSRFYIVRTSWLYGPNGKNFVDTILSMADDRKTLRVVSDQIGTPTCTLSLSETVSDLIMTGRWGIYHGTDDGVTSWYDFAKEILRDRDNEIIPIATKDMPRPATRPKYSVLDKTTLINTIGRELPPWQESLNTYMQLHTGRKETAKK
jgi:dTDP-4-dehydrorhamnose reductase